MLKTIIICLMCFAVFLSADAAVKTFRGGVVLAADFTTRGPEGVKIPENTVNNLYARMVIKLAPERKISIHDYRLRIYGMEFKAVALCMNNGKWLQDGGVFENKSRSDRVGLLFIVDGSVIGKREVEYFEVVASPDKSAPCAEIGFRNIRNSAFTGVMKVPASGSVVK